ncbi:MAG: hypothetical protein GSR84_04530 [Desulfurococcales archaeon]|nr:hypothetical protein [Desulfurococcales archaeon]
MKGLLPLVFFLLLLAGGLLLLLHDNGNSGAGGQDPGPGGGDPCRPYGYSESVKIVSSSFWTDAYLLLEWSNGELTGFQVRYNYTQPRPMAAATGVVEATIDGDVIYTGPPTTIIDIPEAYEDGKTHDITVVHKPCG